MTEVNPRNYPGASATVVGRAAGPYQVRSFGNGGSQAELSIAVGKGYKDRQTQDWVDTGTDWYTLLASSDYASDNWPQIGKGDTVRIDNARLEARPYTSKDGEAKVDLQLRYGTIVVVKRKEEGGGQSSGGYNEPAPF